MKNSKLRYLGIENGYRESLLWILFNILVIYFFDFFVLEKRFYKLVIECLEECKSVYVFC